MPLKDYVARATQTASSTPGIEFLLHNLGGRRILVSSAQLRVDAYAELHQCFFGDNGDVQLTNRYPVTLPIGAAASGRTLDVPLHQQLAADEADRFAFRLGTEDPAWSTYHFYVLHITLTTDATQPKIDAGRVMLMTPGALPRTGEFLPENDELIDSQTGRIDAGQARCYKRNIATIRQMLSRDGRRSADVTALSTFKPASAWLRR